MDLKFLGLLDIVNGIRMFSNKRHRNVGHVTSEKTKRYFTRSEQDADRYVFIEQSQN